MRYVENSRILMADGPCCEQPPTFSDTTLKLLHQTYSTISSHQYTTCSDCVNLDEPWWTTRSSDNATCKLAQNSKVASIGVVTSPLMEFAQESIANVELLSLSKKNRSDPLFWNTNIAEEKDERKDNADSTSTITCSYSEEGNDEVNSAAFSSLVQNMNDLDRLEKLVLEQHKKLDIMWSL